MVHISIDTGTISEVCELTGAANSPIPTDTLFCSLTFNREDRLFASTHKQSLWEIELPSCEAKYVGDYKSGDGTDYRAVCGIAPAHEGNGLLAIAGSASVVVEIDENTATTTRVGKLGESWGNHGATWDGARNRMMGLRGDNDTLYEIDHLTGHATKIATLDVDFSTVGMEFHPRTGKIYGCTNKDSRLFQVGYDGTTKVVGDTGMQTCNNLGAPFAEPELPPLTVIR